MRERKTPPILRPSRKGEAPASPQRSTTEMEADSILTRGTPHLEIRWLGFSEKEIQAILKTHYVALGFDVQWPHDEDPSHEKGIDLDCTDASGQRVILAVKKIPKTEDIVQLQRLARNDAKQRIYVRIKRGTQEFEDETRRQIGRVEFWGSSQTRTGNEREWSDPLAASWGLWSCD